MIFVDRREGSKDLLPLLKTPALLVDLEFADASFNGNGPDGDISIGVERKRIGDLISSIANGRLSGHQLPGLLQDYDLVYLIVEGVFKGDSLDDELLISTTGGKSFKPVSHGRQHWTREGIDHYFTTLESRLYIPHRITTSAKGTAKQLDYLFRYWNKPWEKHASHLALHKGLNFKAADRKVTFMPEALEAPSLVRRIASELPGVGITRSIPVAKRFPSVQAMYEATVEDWQGIEGFGKVTSKMAWEALHGGVK
jgi:ERCC4-type nuclease